MLLYGAGRISGSQTWKRKRDSEPYAGCSHAGIFTRWKVRDTIRIAVRSGKAEQACTVPSLTRGHGREDRGDLSKRNFEHGFLTREGQPVIMPQGQVPEFYAMSGGI